MKRFLILFITAILSLSSVFGQEQTPGALETSTNAISTVYNDMKTGITTVYDDVSGVTGPIYQEVKSAVIAIATGIGVGVEHVYVIIVKKFVVDGISELIKLIALLTILIIGTVNLIKYVNKHTTMDWRIIIPASMVTASLLILSTIEFNEMLINLVNPEWNAIKYILDTAKEFVK